LGAFRKNRDNSVFGEQKAIEYSGDKIDTNSRDRVIYPSV